MDAEDPNYSSEQDEDYAQCLKSTLFEPELEIRDNFLHYFVSPTLAIVSDAAESEEEDDSIYDIDRFFILLVEEVPAAAPLSAEAEPYINYEKSISLTSEELITKLKAKAAHKEVALQEAKQKKQLAHDNKEK